MSKYFSRFPKIKYDDIEIRDITRRNNFVEKNLSDPFIFLPYTVKEGEKPEDIAQLYYGSVGYTWLVLMANNIIDPYYDWPLDEKDFNEYIIKKYEAVSGKKGYEVVDWAKNQTISDNILYYYKDLGEPTPDPNSITVVSDLESLPVTENQIQELFNNETIVINGIRYRLVQE